MIRDYYSTDAGVCHGSKYVQFSACSGRFCCIGDHILQQIGELRPLLWEVLRYLNPGLTHHKIQRAADGGIGSAQRDNVFLAHATHPPS